MRTYLPLVALLLGACYDPNFVSGQVECGPGGACPEGFGCRADNRCWLPQGASEDLSVPPPADLSMGGGGEDLAGPTSPFLRVRGGRIVDGAGREVRLTAISWFGLETSAFAPQGLGARPLGGLLDDIKRLGYNSVRLPFSNQLLEQGTMPTGIDLAQNPELRGLNGPQLLDKVISEAGKRGLRIVLARHQPTGTSGQTPLWYTQTIPEQRWIADWVALATRYRSTATVVGLDLHYEPHAPATWGSDNLMTDWRLAAERAGRAVLAVHPELLIIVQGIDEAGGVGYWWGGNHKLTRMFPVRLPPERLVYGANDYPRSVADQVWFREGSFPNNMPALWDGVWGYLMKDPDPAKNTPVMITGFGGKLDAMSDRQWIGKLGEYIQQNRLSFAYWCLNPDDFFGGILKNDWTTVQDTRQNFIKPLLAPPIP